MLRRQLRCHRRLFPEQQRLDPGRHGRRFTRPGPLQTLLGKIEPDEEAINRGLQLNEVSELAAVIPVHSHYDHAMDAPEVARHDLPQDGFLAARLDDPALVRRDRAERAAAEAAAHDLHRVPNRLPCRDRFAVGGMRTSGQTF